MNNKIMMLSLFICACIVLSLNAPKLRSQGIDSKPVITSYPSYDQYDLPTLAKLADTVVHGVVIKRDKAKVVHIPIHTEIETDNGNKGKSMESIETEVTIKIIDPIKHSLNEETVIYNEEGGETATFVVEPPGGPLQVGEEVIIFLNRAGHSWGEQGVLRVQGGAVNVIHTTETRTTIQLDEMKSILKESLDS